MGCRVGGKRNCGIFYKFYYMIKHIYIENCSNHKYKVQWIVTKQTYPHNQHQDLETKRLSSLQFSCSVVSNSLRPHESQHARPPCPSRTPGVHSDSRPSIGDAIQPSHPLSSPSPSSPNPSQHQSLFQ